MNHSIRTTAEPTPAHGGFRFVAACRRGFTLLEVVLGLGLITMLIGGIYSIATASLQLSNTVLENQAEDMHMDSFIHLLRRNIQGLPGNGRILMEEPTTSGNVYQSELVFEDYPLAFSWGAVSAGSRKVILATEKDSRGGLQFRVRYLNEEEAEAYESGSLGVNDGISLILIDSLRGVRWDFYNQQTDEWLTEWTQPNQRPTLISLSLDFYAVEEPMRVVFWLPTVADPAQITQTAGQTPGAGSGGGTPGGVPTDPRAGGGGGFPGGGPPGAGGRGSDRGGGSNFPGRGGPPQRR